MHHFIYKGKDIYCEIFFSQYWNYSSHIICLSSVDDGNLRQSILFYKFFHFIWYSLNIIFVYFLFLFYFITLGFSMFSGIFLTQCVLILPLNMGKLISDIFLKFILHIYFRNLFHSTFTSIIFLSLPKIALKHEPTF